MTLKNFDGLTRVIRYPKKEWLTLDRNYYNTFIEVAADCPASSASVPPVNKKGKTKAAIEYELLSAHPYAFTQEDLLFEVHARHKGIPEEELIGQRTAFFQKPQPCFRSSMLPKKYGWGIHFNEAGKAAMVAMDSPGYEKFLNGEASGVKRVKAMRNKREQTDAKKR
ncbi:DUF6157 family protein [Planococcus sp. YIM B11945]|uniref:DUF6157 family protein n=1 Tax=Planococcus sp. YIM B11945 TaxID=3435410 RepID=UPI003D7E190C